MGLTASRYHVEIGDGVGGSFPLTLATDERDRPIFRSETLRQIQPTVQVGEASYASYQPERTGVYVQPDLSLGVGSKVQKLSGDPDAKRCQYCEWMDTSVPGQVQKGPAVTTVTAPANSGKLTGFYVLGGTPYLLLSRIIASYASGALTQVRDMGAAGVASGAASFFQLGAEASTEANTGDAATTTVTSSDHRVAQQVRLDDTGARFISRVDAKLISANPSSITGDVRLTIQGDLDDKPDGNIRATARMLAANVSTSATVYTFRFDDDESLAVTGEDLFWLVLDATGVTAANTIGWRNGTTSAYSRGLSATSSNGGGAWTTSATDDMYFDVFTKAATATAFVGADDSVPNYLAVTTDGSSYTADSFRRATQFAVVGDTLVRDVRSLGVIEWTRNGRNWSEPLPVGDVTVPVTALLALGEVLIVCKQDSVWAVDITAATHTALPEMQPLVSASAVSTNGVGATVWNGKGSAFVPWEGGLLAVSGDFDGFEVTLDCSMRTLPEWDFPHGAGRIVAVAADRFHLYAILSATNGYRLYKASDPVKRRDWNGSLATIGDGTQTIERAFVHDPGGTTNPRLFCTTTSNDIADIILPINANPANDTGYRYDISTPGDVYFPNATGNFPVNQKGWFSEAVTFLRHPSGDYVDVLYDDQDGRGWRRPKDRGGRLWDTGVVKYPTNTASRLFGRRLRVVNSAATNCPIIVASGLSFAVRSITGVPMRAITFAVDVEDGVTAIDLGDRLGLTAEALQRELEEVPAVGGSRLLRTPSGKTLEVVFTSTRDTLLRVGGRERWVVEVECVQVG